MKKTILCMATTAILLAMVSCQEKIQTTKAFVRKMNDTVMTASIDKYDIKFDIKKARCDNGAVMPGDSVVIHYIGDLREKQARALLLRLMPKKGTVVEAVYDPSKELIVSDQPLTEEEAANLKKFANTK